MPVRGTTHARHMRKVVILEGTDKGDKILCGWDDCPDDGFIQYHVAVNQAKPGFPRQLARYVFCSERHRQFWLNSVRSYGNLPDGSRGTIL